MMSSLTLGTAQLGMEYGINNKTGKPNLTESIRLLNKAYNKGVNSFDTASVYGDSEVILGSWLKDKKLDKPIITTKLPSLTAQNIEHDQLGLNIWKNVKESLNALNIKRIDYYLIHDFKDVKKYGAELFKTLVKIKNEGLIENYGCSIYNLEELQFLKQFNIDALQIPASIFNQQILESQTLKEFKKDRTKIFVRSALVQGLIFMEYSKIPQSLRGIKPYLEVLNTISKENDLKILDIAINYVRNHENTDSVVFGVETLEQLEEILSISKNNELDKRVINNYFSKIPVGLIDPRNWR